jgi:hypothetical protein
LRSFAFKAKPLLMEKRTSRKPGSNLLLIKLCGEECAERTQA